MPKNSAEYQRAYRERTRLSAPTVADERRYVNPPGLNSKYQYLPGDHAVGDMTQRGRDRVLARMNAR